MVDMEVTDEQVHGFFLGDITVRFGNAVTRVKDNIILFVTGQGQNTCYR